MSSSSTLLDHSGQLPQVAQATLFKDPWTCQAILRALSPLAQQYVLRLAGAQNPLPTALVHAWAQPNREAQTKHALAISQLTSLGLLTEASVGNAGSHFKLHAEFGTQLLLALRGGEASGVRGTELSQDKSKPTLAQLEAHAVRTWEMVLQAVLTPPRKPLQLHMAGSSLQALLHEAGLLEPREGAAGAGYEMGGGARRFLLLPVHAQVWRLMMAYMSIAEGSGVGARDAVLSFLMRLGFLEQGADYPVEGLSNEQQLVLKDLVTLGLVYMRKLNSRRYYTTPLAVRLLSGAAHATQAGGRGFLVLETNFRLYAYTESRLWAEVIGEFTEVLYALPNLLVAQITRESVLRAVDNGVEPQEVIDFLERNAHPLMAAQTPVLPETVVEQVRLWAKERDRIRAAPARLYEHFASVAVFDKAEQYARDNGVHLWSKRDAARPAACQLVVVADAHERMKSFLRSLRPAAS